jgi:O-methyltransferase
MITRRSQIDAFIAQWPIIPGMMDQEALRIILTALDRTYDEEVPGDLVELGCHQGSTSLFLQRYLDTMNPFSGDRPKSLHVYDAFKGLPAPTEKDGEALARFVEGACFGTVEMFLANFLQAGLRPPFMHLGWFTEATYPDPISFAFFDSDRYQSTMDSFDKVWPRLSPGGVIVVHDVALPGCGSGQAVKDFGQPWTEEYGCATIVKGS